MVRPSGQEEPSWRFGGDRFGDAERAPLNHIVVVTPVAGGAAEATGPDGGGAGGGSGGGSDGAPDEDGGSPSKEGGVRTSTGTAGPTGGVSEVESAMYAAAAARIRKTAEWIAGAFAAIGAALIGSAPFTGFDELGGEDLVVAIVGATLGLGGVLLVITAAAAVMLPESATASDIQDGSAGISARTRARLVRRRTGSHGGSTERWDFFDGVADDIDQLRRVLAAARAELDEVRRARRSLAAGATPPSKADEARADRRVALAEVEVREAMAVYRNLESLCAYEEIRERFRHAMAWMVGAAILAALGAGIWFSAVSGGGSEDSGAADTSGATDEAPVLGDLQLTEAGSAIADALDCSGTTSLTVAVLGGDGSAQAPWSVQTLDDGPCDAARFTVSPDRGSVVVPTTPEVDLGTPTAADDGDNRALQVLIVLGTALLVAIALTTCYRSLHLRSTDGGGRTTEDDRAPPEGGHPEPPEPVPDGTPPTR